MADKNFAADPDALRDSSRKLAAIRDRVDQLANDVNNIAVAYPNAAGDGTYREQFDNKYVPMETASLAFMDVLAAAVESVSGGTAAAADVFDNADDDATSHARRS